MSMKTLSELASLGALVSNPDSKRFQTVPIDEVVSKAQPRKKFLFIEELAQTLNTVGMLQPITVSPRNSDGKYVIQMGERRYRAAKLAGWTHVKVFIADEYESREQGLAREIIENTQRQDLEPLEIAEALRQLSEDHGMSVRDIAKQLGVNKTYVGNHLKLLKVHPELQQLMIDGVLRDVETINSLDIAFSKIPERIDEIVKRIREDGITRAQARELAKVVRKNNKDSDDASTVLTDTDTRTDAGAAITSPSSTYEGMDAVHTPATRDTAQEGGENVPADTTAESAEALEQNDHTIREEDSDKSGARAEGDVTASDSASVPEPKPSKKKPAKSANQFVEMVTGGHKPYVVVLPNEAVVQVMVRLDDDQEYGATLLFDHVDLREGYVCVLLEGDEQPISVMAENVRLKEVRAIDDGEN